MGEKFFAGGNGFEFMEGYFKELYGQEGAIEAVFNRYLRSNEFNDCARYITCIEDIPIFSTETIFEIVKRNENVKNEIVAFLQRYERNSANASQEYLFWEASFLGLIPNTYPDLTPLFWNLLNYEADRLPQIRKEVFQKLSNRINLLKLMLDGVYDWLRPGLIFRIPDGNRLVWSQGATECFFRGENAFYGKSVGAVFRGTNGEPASQDLITLRNVLIIDFSLFLQKLPFVKDWKISDWFNLCVAQHYGIPTNMMDFSSDFKVALFFACTTWDSQNKKWRPLTKEDFDPSGRRKYITDNGGDPRYGVVYRAPADINLYCASDPTKRRLTPVYPIGFQPFFRCHSQKGFYVRMFKGQDLYKDQTFDKMRFELTEDLCQWIYDEMDQGRKIYSESDPREYDDIVTSLLSDKEYSMAALDFLFKKWGMLDQKDEYIKRFAKMGYTAVEKLRFDNEEMIAKIQSAFEKSGGSSTFQKLPQFRRMMFAF